MRRPEILAPAGSPDALTAALRCGADAVYLGTQTLNARRGAVNFDDDALRRAAFLCHVYGAKLYLTLNTLASDAEAQQVRSVLRTAAQCGVDALIVQDMGVARMARESCDIALHASTQTSVQTPAGVQLLREAGFTRVVVPRELERSELREICESTDMEIEVFVHGALCMSVSGQCLLSAVFGGRSGNRGLCAQPCRLPFAVRGGTGHDLSLKDLSLLRHARELAAVGVDSLKIEGRMKRPEYVAAAVTACKAALDGAGDDAIFDALRSVFSRSGFTDGYYTGNRGVSMFGTRQKEDVTAASGVLNDLQKLYAAVPGKYPVRFSLTCRAGEPVRLTAESGGFQAQAAGEIPAPAQNRALDAASAEKQMQKCGGTLFYPASFDSDIQDGLFLPASSLNALRRDALDALAFRMAQRPAHHFTQTEAAVPAHEAAGEPKRYARFADEAQIPQGLEADKVILPLYCGAQTIARHAAAVEIPRGLFRRAQQVRTELLRCRACGVREAVCGTADAFVLARECGLVPIMGFGSNIFNTQSLLEWQTRGAAGALLSPELPLSAARTLGGTIPRGVFAYGRLPLMLTRNCPQRNGKTCGECRRTGTLTDRKGVTFPIECRSGCAEVLNSCPVYLADKQREMAGLDFMLLYFTTEDAHACGDVLRAFRAQTPGEGAFTRGLAFRGVE